MAAGTGSVVFQVASDTCPVHGSGWLDSSDNKLEWRLSNDGSYDLDGIQGDG